MQHHADKEPPIDVLINNAGVPICAATRFISAERVRSAKYTECRTPGAQSHGLFRCDGGIAGAPLGRGSRACH